MIDPITRYRIIPAIVTEIRNRCFFVVTPIYEQNGQKAAPIVVHRGSPDLLPGNWCARTGMRLTMPKGLLSSFEIA